MYRFSIFSARNFRFFHLWSKVTWKYKLWYAMDTLFILGTFSALRFLWIYVLYIHKAKKTLQLDIAIYTDMCLYSPKVHESLASLNYSCESVSFSALFLHFLQHIYLLIYANFDWLNLWLVFFAREIWVHSHLAAAAY